MTSGKRIRGRRIVAALTLGVCTSVAIPAAAQTLTGSVSTGLSMARFTGDGVSQVEFRNAPFLAVSIAAHPWQSRFGFEGGVGYMMKGSSWIDGIRNTLRLNYVEAQALLRVAIPIEGADLRPALFAGPTVAWLLKCEMHGSYGGATVTRACDDPGWQSTLDARDVDYGYVLGGTLELRTRGSLVVAPRIAHSRGLPRIGIGPTDQELDVRNSNTALGVTVSVPLR